MDSTIEKHLRGPWEEKEVARKSNGGSRAERERERGKREGRENHNTLSEFQGMR
jgi:hypothetical protein